ncbi:MAG: uncharacterized protein PWR17_695 [Candidatus Methanomethylophilaceae archaeon]|nr:uncharacterized protein [Candidatus Methanomethylophilaceae archaeon]
MAKEIIRKSYIERLEEFKDRPDLVKIVIGVRRSGKSTLLAQFRERLENKGENVVSINLEEKRFSVTTKRELNSYVTELMTSPKDYVLLDEVQYIAGWEDVVNTLRSNGANVYVTGSNAKVLSSEFSTIIAEDMPRSTCSLSLSRSFLRDIRRRARPGSSRGSTSISFRAGCRS